MGISTQGGFLHTLQHVIAGFPSTKTCHFRSLQFRSIREEAHSLKSTFPTKSIQLRGRLASALHCDSALFPRSTPQQLRLPFIHCLGLGSIPCSLLRMSCSRNPSPSVLQGMAHLNGHIVFCTIAFSFHRFNSFGATPLS